jgi:hypothetical protein
LRTLRIDTARSKTEGENQRFSRVLRGHRVSVPAVGNPGTEV